MSYKIALFGLTGFGSQMLRYLFDLGMNVQQVFTRRERFEHPYFPVTSVEDIARLHGVRCSFQMPDTISEDIDLILCSTYHRIIPLEILVAARLGAFNFHPSLLPAYRGATPTKHCLLNGETVTGMTVHMLSEKVDGGQIIAQRRLLIEDYFDDGLLRQQLSALQYPLLLDLMRHLDGTGETPCFGKDVESSSYSRFNALQVSYSPDISVLTLSRQLRASSPFPGLALTIKGKTYKATKQLSYATGIFESSINTEGKVVTICGPDGMLKMIGETT
jgi:methionyl-tRNA formyltransferase